MNATHIREQLEALTPFSTGKVVHNGYEITVARHTDGKYNICTSRNMGSTWLNLELATARIVEAYDLADSAFQPVASKETPSAFDFNYVSTLPVENLRPLFSELTGGCVIDATLITPELNDEATAGDERHLGRWASQYADSQEPCTLVTPLEEFLTSYDTEQAALLVAFCDAVVPPLEVPTEWTDEHALCTME